MSERYLMHLVPVPDSYEFAPDALALTRAAEVLRDHAYFPGATPLRVLLAGPEKSTRDTVVDQRVGFEQAMTLLLQSMSPSDQVRVEAESKSYDLSGQWWERFDATEEGERLAEEGVTPRAVRYTALNLVKKLALFPGVEGLRCTSCGGQVTQHADELWGPDDYGSDSFGVQFGLSPTCPSCGVEPKPSAFRAHSEASSYPIPFFRFSVALETYFYPHGGEPSVPPSLLTDLGAALGCPLRAWHHHDV